MIALVLAACSGPPDPDLRAKREAVDAFERAKAQLEGGDASAARSTFAAIPAVHPIVDAWEARAAAAAGDVEGALAILDAVVAEHPELAVARYNRSAYLARLGRHEQAGQELEIAIELGAASVRDAIADPDFASHLDHPAFSLIASSALIVAVESPPASTFLGSEVRLTLRVTGAGDGPIAVASAEARGPVSLVEHVESRTDPLEGPGRTLTWAWRVDGPGTVRLDPLLVTAGPLSAETAGATVEAAAPPDRGDPTPRPIAFPVASGIGAGLGLGAARWVDGQLQVKVAGTDRLVRQPPGPPPRRYTYREGGVTVWVVQEYTDDPTITSISRTVGPRKAEPVAIPPRPPASPPPTGD